MPEPLPQSCTNNIRVFPGCDPGDMLCSRFRQDAIHSKSELLILNWLVSIPEAIDPAHAARAVLGTLELPGAGYSPDQSSVLALLREIACHPRQRLLPGRTSSGRRSRSSR